MKDGVGVLASGSERLRAGTWRADEGVAYLAPVADAPAPSTSFVRRCLGELTGQGFSSVVTAALSPSETPAFVALGFVEHERLRLLTHDLRHLPATSGPATSAPRPRRVHRNDRAGVLAVDTASFPPFWQLDQVGLDGAVAATPTAHFRVVTAHHDDVVGYAITGRAGREGYVQRLAVRPDRQGQGLGRALALDGLHWLRRRRVRRAIVNTQQGNQVALSFYRHLGFRPEPSDLVVLRRDLG